MRRVLLTLSALLLTAHLFGQTHSDHRPFNGIYQNEYLPHIAFPIGGIGAGMFCLEGTGAISHLSVRHAPEMFNEPCAFAAISIKEMPGRARVLEGPVPDWKKFGLAGSGTGASGSTWGLARFRDVSFLARFPFGEVHLHDPELPVDVHITGWSPFIPTDADNSSLPVGALEYRFRNTGKTTLHFVFSYNARNFMALSSRADPKASNRIRKTSNGFILSQDSSVDAPDRYGDFAIFTEESATRVDYCWFRGGAFDPLTMIWQIIQKGNMDITDTVAADAPGASLFVPFTVRPGEERNIRLLMAWYVPNSHLRTGRPPSDKKDSVVRDASVDLPSPFYKPWYSSRFTGIGDLTHYWLNHYEDLQDKTKKFRDAFYGSTLPPEVLEAVSANLSILKSPTVMRQYDGRFWAWEGCDDASGSCAGSCTHVWNYAQALPHLFPSLERGLRETEFHESQNADGHQAFRSALPIRPQAHTFYAASDGQLGGIMKVYRDWRISGDSAWLAALYPYVKTSLDYCIRSWDPRHYGTLEEPHHNTYDIEFWGSDPMCTSFYLGALEAFIRMGDYLHQDVQLYLDLYSKGRTYMEKQLYNGRYFIQQIQWAGLNATDPVGAAKGGLNGDYSEEALKLLQKEGPKYQYGTGCLSDGVVGTWMARVCGLPEPIDTGEVASHLQSVYKYNFKRDLTDYSNPQRSTYALGNEGGLLLCTWPMGGQLSLPFFYSNEVWTGIEYDVASDLIFHGHVKEGLDIVRTCRTRYDGRVRNPFDEYECGHWYARAMSSYALLESLTGVRYDAVEKTLYIYSNVGDFTSFLSTDTGFGTVTFRHGKTTVNPVVGTIRVAKVIVN